MSLSKYKILFFLTFWSLCDIAAAQFFSPFSRGKEYRSEINISSDLTVGFEAPDQFAFKAGFNISKFERCYHVASQKYNIYGCGHIRYRNSYMFGYIPQLKSYQLATDFNYTFLILTANLNVNYTWDRDGNSRLGFSPQLGFDFKAAAILSGLNFYLDNDFSDRSSRFTVQLHIYIPRVYRKVLK